MFIRKFAALFQDVNTKKYCAFLAVSLWNKLSFTAIKQISGEFLKICSKICNEHKIFESIKID